MKLLHSKANANHNAIHGYVSNGRGLGFLVILILWCGLLIGSATTFAKTEVLLPQYTKGFAIEYLTGGVKKIKDEAGRFLWLVPRGKPAPAGVPKAQIIYIPVQRACFTSVTQVCWLRPWADRAAWQSVVGVNNRLEEWYLPQIKSGLQQGFITYLGDAYAPDYELLQELQPEVIFVYTGPSGLNGLVQKIEELSLPYVVENSYLETNPLGRMEWLKLVAAFYDQETKAEIYFDQAVARINKLNDEILSLGLPRTKVAWGMIYNGKAYIPGKNSYVAQMIELAGGENVFAGLSDAKGSVAVSLENFYACSNEAELMIYATYPEFVPTIESIWKQLPILKGIKPLQTGQVWAMQPWYNQQYDRLDTIIADLAALFYPQHFQAAKIKNFKKLRNPSND